MSSECANGAWYPEAPSWNSGKYLLTSHTHTHTNSQTRTTCRWIWVSFCLRLMRAHTPQNVATCCKGDRERCCCCCRCIFLCAKMHVQRRGITTLPPSPKMLCRDAAPRTSIAKCCDARRTLHRVVLCPPAPPERVRCTPKKRDEKGSSTACALAYRCVCVVCMLAEPSPPRSQHSAIRWCERAWVCTVSAVAMWTSARDGLCMCACVWWVDPLLLSFFACCRLAWNIVRVVDSAVVS